MFKKNLWQFSVLISIMVLTLMFQNCGSSRTYSEKPADPEAAELGSNDEDNADGEDPSQCDFNGGKMDSGTGTLAYLTSTVPAGQTCAFEIRTCDEGVLSGSYEYASCTPGSAAACLFNGQTIPHGKKVNAYQAAIVAYGGTCAYESRTCDNGVLSGSYAQSTCSVANASSCTLGTQTIAHGQSVTAYSASSVPNGQVCSAISQTRTCNNGALSGTATYSHTSCSVSGLVSTGVTVNISCSISAANTQVLVATMSNGVQKTWNLGSGNKTVPTFTYTFPSAPTAFQAYSNSQLSAHRFSNQTSKTFRFESEDGADNDYNDLICNFSW